jgi:hypothetical protein
MPSAVSVLVRHGLCQLLMQIKSIFRGGNYRHGVGRDDGRLYGRAVLCQSAALDLDCIAGDGWCCGQAGEGGISFAAMAGQHAASH